MRPTLDIDLLRTFHAIARLGQFRAAAAFVNRSPAAVSVHIQRLEQVVGGRLLERDNQSVVLTPLGSKLLASTLGLLSAHDDILRELQGAPLSGHIKLGLPDEYASHVIRHILPRFADSFPAVELEVSTAASQALVDQIGRNRLHLALVVQPSGRHCQTPVAVTVPVWAGGRSLALQANRPLPLALHAADCPYREAMLEALTSAGRQWRVILSSPSASVVAACVEAGLAVTLLDRARLSGAMRILEALPPVAPYEVQLLRSVAADGEPATAMLEKVIGEYFQGGEHIVQ
ncbi:MULTISPECIES: LysR substrate-binding domain-containing protein [Serratia]|uniref:LysR substrate-binding domain-containing protein n=1 Tax=Serratia TaxID=613 RepID=UPI000D17A2B4|nr:MULTISPECIES: LysR substrate-binding domain-containing protein [Serratia]MDH2270026.1 LysR substrate-binding domain-containing protein [Serratia marcescens]MDH2278003.1 LysR substrate-binding domain-containing protein [Serratia marcescens]PTA80259.1 LysR family transcriptional regulator [Serratia sp. Nf2]